MGNNSGKRSLSQSTDDSVIREDENWMKDVDSEANHPNLAPYSNLTAEENDFEPKRRVRASTLSSTVNIDKKKLPTVFKWEGGGKNVFISGSFNSWKKKISMVKSTGDFYAIIDLPEGTHQYKFYVDGQWLCDSKEQKTESDLGTENNIVTVRASDFEVFEALATDSVNSGQNRGTGRHYSKDEVTGSPPGDYSQEVPPRHSSHGFSHSGPPILPPHLLQVILNKEIPVHCEPTLLPEPNHVMLNHLYALSIKESKPDLKKIRKEAKERKRKWKEEKLIKRLEKRKKREETEQINKLEEESKLKKKENCYTVSIALPGSILDNAQSPELRTYLAGQIARSAAIFNVNEIIIFDEVGKAALTTEGTFEGIGKSTKTSNCNIQLARILQYLECPQYLRKNFFPVHEDLKYAGLLNPLDSVHHYRSEDDATYREGVVTKMKVKEDKGSLVDVGLEKLVRIDKQLDPGFRVTVRLDKTTMDNKKPRGVVVSPDEPRELGNLYWGYSVRLAPNLSSVLIKSPYKGGYDLVIGTSDKGDSIDRFEPEENFKHALIVFGGLKGLEASLESDEKLTVGDPRELFEYYVNVCPYQGSRTIRTEEALLIALSAIRPKLAMSKLKLTENSND
ncbi:DgyrCDS7512 [Dimorphilus gyrociliatus]|uniref:DgyrCDS7512 n=1 Tax=Dimorphilus gyrociliatus TaxID=2664684 RepID=A0A7I8VTG5_9ANNE|nr:DgyrCDS7512 [Dimorphilus gyrociliatus]